MAEIRNIIFDMGGVLIDYNPEKTLYSVFDRETADIALREIFRNPVWAEKDRGTVSADDILYMAKDKIPVCAYEKIAEMTRNLYPYMTPFGETEEIVVKLKANGYRIFLLSNASLDFHIQRKNIPALKIFDGCLISADCRIIKPEPGIYERLLSKFNLRAEECFFIDDVAKNCEAAERAGIRSYNHKLYDFDSLIKAMKENGIDI